MNGQSKVTIVVLALSVISLYVETILQVYVCVTAQDTPVNKTPTAITSLCLVFIAFVMSSVISAYLAHTTMQFDGHWTGKVIFWSCHILCFGMFWRIFKLIASFSDLNIKQLAIIRLIHVAIQSCPFVIVYSSIFITAGKINVIQFFSLLLSVISTALAITCYSLRTKMCNADASDRDSKREIFLGCASVYAALVSTFIGTFLVISTRLTSISFMASQEPYWVFLPLGCHFLALLVIFSTCSSRLTAKKKALTPLDIATHCWWSVGMSILNCFDLVSDKIERLMCKYVGFYSLILVENIVFLSFWLLRFDMDRVGKLVFVVGLLTGFIIGLVAKFVSCNVTRRDKTATAVDSPPQTTVLTISNISSGVSHNKNDDLDLISIVQASMYRQSHQTSGLEAIYGKKVQEKGKHKGKVKENEENIPEQSSRTRERKRGVSKHVERKPSQKAHHHQSRGIPLSVMSQVNENVRRDAPINTIDLDASFQPGSMFNISDPGTIRSDMMYKADNKDVGCEQLDVNIASLQRRKHYQDNLPNKSLPTGAMSRGYPGEELVYGMYSLQRPGDADERKGKTQSRISNNEKLGFQITTCNPYTERKRTQYTPHTANQESIQLNECSDTAISSAKTYPIEAKKSDLKSYDNPLMYRSNVGQRMNAIISSLGDKHTKDKSNDCRYLRNAPNSDDDIVRYKYSNRAFHAPRNRISYADADDIVPPAENVAHSPQDDPRTIVVSGAERKSAKPAKGLSQSKSKSTPATVLSPSTMQLCESGSSSVTSMTLDNNAFTKTSSSSSSSSATIKQPYWIGPDHQRKELFLPDETSQIPASENVLRWLAGTEDSDNEAQV